jgi:excisionase family DNA binding protein
MTSADFLTIHEAAMKLGKSSQTIRRMIKRGDIRARRVKTPQGFHYVIKKDELPLGKLKVPEYIPPIEESEEFLTSTLKAHAHQVEVEANAQAEAVEAARVAPTVQVVPALQVVPTVQVAPPQTEVVEAQELFSRFLTILERNHEEKTHLLHLAERLQSELDLERRKPRSLFAYLMDWFFRT